MKVIFMPDYRKDNLYQTNLSDALLKQGVSVHFSGSIIKSTVNYWKPDIIHIHWPYPFMITDSRLTTIVKSTSFIFWLILLKLFGIKIVWTVHNISDHERKFKHLEPLFNNIFARLCNKLIVHCPSVKTEIEKIYGKDEFSITVIPHGNYMGQYENNITTEEARNKLRLRENDLVFLYFGQIRSYKGVPELIEIFNKLNSQRVKLLIVGKPLNDEIALDIFNRCTNNRNIISILRFISNNEIQNYMNAADVVVLPYKNVLTSGAAILAMSFGKAIIAPSIKCVADTLDEKGSFLYKKDNLFDAMKQALDSDSIMITNMGMHNLELAKQFPWSEIAKMTYDTYQECVAG